MIRINENYQKVSKNYLFSEIAKKVAEYKALHPEDEIISLGIGDVTSPLSPSVIDAMHSAVSEMADSRTFRGYAPECGYRFLIDKIIEYDYSARGVTLSPDEVFINDGAKSALGHFGDILSTQNVVAISDPVYPAYIDTNIMDGRGGKLLSSGCQSNIIYLTCLPEENFIPKLPDKRPDIIYLCSPNNPTGSVLNRTQLKAWVDYARENSSLILFDAAYEAYISNQQIPHSIYEIKGAKEVAVEFKSFSKTAGFTGVRCGYVVVPHDLKAYDSLGYPISLNTLWRRHQSTKFNGTSYIVQRAAEAVYTPQGQIETKQTIAYYMRNAQRILEGMRSIGIRAYGGESAPYIWVETPNKTDSWTFFDKLLNECQVVGTPGIGFGPSGAGYFRFTAFAKAEKVNQAINRIKNWHI